jgi:hypothetical protein
MTAPIAAPTERSYATAQHRILAGLTRAQRKWERRTGARLVRLRWPPYFRYVVADDQLVAA